MGKLSNYEITTPLISLDTFCKTMKNKLHRSLVKTYSVIQVEDFEHSSQIFDIQYVGKSTLQFFAKSYWSSSSSDY